MWYDLFILAVLVFFTISGAARGVVWQIAGIAGILLCFAFADAISNAFGPYVHLAPPLNHWAVLFAAYLIFSFLSFGIARMLNEAIEKAEMKEFNRHLGAAFGLLKGVILGLIITYLVVTVSPDAREALKHSRSGYYAAHIMNRLHPIMPAKLHAALADYIHLLDHNDLGLPPTTHHDHAHEGTTPLGNSSPVLGNNGLNPFGTNTGQSNPAFGQANSIPNSGPPISIEGFFNDVKGKLSTQAKNVVLESFQNQVNSQSPEAQTQLKQLQQIIEQTPNRDLATLQRELVNAGAGRLDQFIASKLGTSAPVQTPNPYQSSIPNGQSSIPNSPPQSNPWFTPPGTPTPAPATMNVDETIRQISTRLSTLPPVQQGIATQIKQSLSTLPGAVSQELLKDWYADIFQPQSDPNSQTNANTGFEIRVLKATEQSGLTLGSLNPQWQQAIQAVLARNPQSNNAL